MQFVPHREQYIFILKVNRLNVVEGNNWYLLCEYDTRVGKMLKQVVDIITTVR
jgi:hypothetical protein